jgi:hypothetical protein
MAETAGRRRTAPRAAIRPGEPWYDTDGNRIEAHGGGMLFHEGRYFWYGENHALGFRNRTGISCYSSSDLVTWRSEGLALPKDALPVDYRDDGACERPKVIRNPRTGLFVMWMHLDADGYTHSRAGVAVAENPAGPFELVKACRPVVYDYGYDRPDLGRGLHQDLLRERLARINDGPHGNAVCDLALYVDHDGCAYLAFDSQGDEALYVCRLEAEYTDVERSAEIGKTFVRLFPRNRREAPAFCAHRGVYPNDALKSGQYFMPHSPVPA